MNVQLRKCIFRVVRDLPYRIAGADRDTSCVAKTKLLGELLTRAGLECQVWKATVSWHTTGVPNRLLALAPRRDFNHFFLKVYIPENRMWVIVDATWDARFRGILPVNDWDGLRDTQLAYPSATLEVVGPVSALQFRDFDPTDRFTKQLNEWYRSLAERK